jgi:hypothetical protein
VQLFWSRLGNGLTRTIIDQTRNIEEQDMKDSTNNQPGQHITRRAFLNQAFTLTGVSAGVALLNACGAAGATATAVPPAAQQPTVPTVSAPTVIEYSPQSMGGNAANHIHGIYRDPTNEYGAKYAQ